MKRTFNLQKLFDEYNKIHTCTVKIIDSDIRQAKLRMPVDLGYGRPYVTYARSSTNYPHEVRLSSFLNEFVVGVSYGSLISFVSKQQIGELKIEIWPPEQIRYAYLHRNYAAQAGSLGSSCMRYEGMQKALNFYVKNGVEIVVVVSANKKIFARALLWKDLKTTYTATKKKLTYLDRVYSTSDKHNSYYNELVKKNNWLRYGGTVVGGGKKNLYKDNIVLDGICHLPYTDTFRVLYFTDKILTGGCKPSSVKNNHDIITLTHTGNGGYFRQLDPNSVREEFTECWVSKKDCVFVKQYDGYIQKKHIIDIDNKYYSSYDNKQIRKSPIDGYILKSDVVIEAITKNEIAKSKAIKSKYYKKYVHKKHAVKIYDTIYHKDDKDIAKFGKKYYHISQCVRNYKQDYKGNYFPDGNMIPKSKVLITYNLSEDKVTGEILFSKYYIPNTSDKYIELQTGEYIYKTDANRKFLKRFNSKYYVAKHLELPDKNQLKFSFMKTGG
jgi:hypothetical protein